MIRCDLCGQEKLHYGMGWCQECYTQWYNEQRDLKPSTETDGYWIYAEVLNEKKNYPKSTKRGGKWLVFIHKTKIDQVWKTIRSASERGELGNSAKVSTARPNPNSANPDDHVICIYTYDSEDIPDVMTIRQKLRDLGITKKIPYKTNQATMEHKYQTHGNKRISKYFE